MKINWLIRIRRAGVLGVMSGCVLNLPLCADNENFREFRETAGPGVQSGLKAILQGGEDNTGLATILDSVIDGLFEIVAPDADSGS